MNDRKNFRIQSHPVLDVPERKKIAFTFDGEQIEALEGEVITTALFAAGIRVFGHHESDDAPQGIFCANGQCSQCMVVADGVPVKGCMVPVKDGMDVRSCDGFPELDLEVSLPEFGEIETVKTEVLIIGGGPAGLMAAAELGELGVKTLVVDDKYELGGKLTLQTHQFFGSIDDCYAGTRGINIARILSDKVDALDSVDVWLGATALGVYVDRKIGILKGGRYVLVEPEVTLVACGAREKALAFPGCDLPGVYGAGAFQTLVNRDLVKASERLFVIGGGNVGLIGAYHAIQAGIEVVGLVEALPEVGGYKVHKDKIMRLGIPVWTSHTVVRAEGDGKLERVTIAEIDKSFKVVEGTERTFEVDTLLVAVGLSPIDELFRKAREFGMKALAAGDTEEIAEASAAIFSGKIKGREIARMLGKKIDIPSDWEKKAEVLRSRPGETSRFEPVVPDDAEAYPLFRCQQEIPCNPCTEVCPKGSINIPGDSIMGEPVFSGECIKCGKCVLICPGLAITIVIEHDPEKKTAMLMMAYELPVDDLPQGATVKTVDTDGHMVGEGRVAKIRSAKSQDRRHLVTIEVPYDERLDVAGFRMQDEIPHLAAESARGDEDPVICRCERIRKSAIVAEIRKGVRDMNQLKASIGTGLGACGGKTCTELILRIFREEGVALEDVTLPTKRPLEAETPLEVFAGVRGKGGDHER